MTCERCAALAEKTGVADWECSDCWCARVQREGDEYRRLADRRARIWFAIELAATAFLVVWTWLSLRGAP